MWSVGRPDGQLMRGAFFILLMDAFMDGAIFNLCIRRGKQIEKQKRPLLVYENAGKLKLQPQQYCNQKQNTKQKKNKNYFDYNTFSRYVQPTATKYNEYGWIGTAYVTQVEV